MKTHQLMAAVLLAAGFWAVACGQPVAPESFDLNGDGKLDKRELRLFVIKRDKLTPNVAQFLTNDLKLNVAPQDLEKAMEKDLLAQADFEVGRIAAIINDGTTWPYPIDSVVHALAKVDRPTLKPERLQLPAPWGEKLTKSDVSFGPIALRKSVDDLEKSLTDAPGAKVSHSRNRLTDKTTWTTEGALIFPISWQDDEATENRFSARWKALPSVNWKVVNVGDTQTGDAEELQLKVPVVMSINHRGTSLLRNSELSLAPYFLTDFGVRGKLAGASLSYTPYLKPADGGLEINAGYRYMSTTRSAWMYRIGLTPTLDYNHLYSTSRFITRTSDSDYFRGGGKAEVGFLTNTSPALELRASYKGFWRIEGGPNQSDLLTVSGKLWLNDNAGFTLEHQKGSTPVADKAVDITTLGLELRF
jgi:hypothetical protein